MLHCDSSMIHSISAWTPIDTQKKIEILNTFIAKASIICKYISATTFVFFFKFPLAYLCFIVSHICCCCLLYLYCKCQRMNEMGEIRCNELINEMIEWFHVLLCALTFFYNSTTTHVFMKFHRIFEFTFGCFFTIIFILSMWFVQFLNNKDFH